MALTCWPLHPMNTASLSTHLVPSSSDRASCSPLSWRNKNIVPADRRILRLLLLFFVLFSKEPMPGRYCRDLQIFTIQVSESMSDHFRAWISPALAPISKANVTASLVSLTKQMPVLYDLAFLPSLR